MAKKKEENATVNTQEIKTKFQQKMGELLEIAKKKRNILEYQEISDHFKELNLDAEQFEAVLDFLEHNGRRKCCNRENPASESPHGRG